MTMPTRYTPEVQAHIQQIAVKILELAQAPGWNIVSAIDAASTAARRLNNDYMKSLAERRTKK